MKILLLSFILFSNFINALKEELNSTNKITKIILDNKLPKPTAWKIYEFSESIKGRKDIWLDRNDSKSFFNEKNKKFFGQAEESHFVYLKKIYYSSIPLNKKIKTFKDHPVLYGYYKAWVDHCPISISPNIIWQLILNGIIQHINDKSEELRHNFVEFKDKKTLTVKIYRNDPNINKEDWEIFINNISKQIKENTKEDIYDNIVLNFTTNTKDLLLVQQISSMSVLKNYFEYEFEVEIVCGFPYIELEGEIEDWQLILNKIQKFKNLGIDNWIEIIEKILIKIINSKKGEIDIHFWKNLIIYREEPEYEDEEEGHLCGEPEPIIGFTGWIINFFPFTNDGGYLFADRQDSIYRDITIFDQDFFMKEKDFLISEISGTPFKLHINESYNKEENKEFNLTIYSGILGVSQDPDTLVVKPELGFLIADNNEKESYELDPIKEMISEIKNQNNTDL